MSSPRIVHLSVVLRDIKHLIVDFDFLGLPTDGLDAAAREAVAALDAESRR